jgi:hypothetical protein
VVARIPGLSKLRAMQVRHHRLHHAHRWSTSTSIRPMPATASPECYGADCGSVRMRHVWGSDPRLFPHDSRNTLRMPHGPGSERSGSREGRLSSALPNCLEPLAIRLVGVLADHV